MKVTILFAVLGLAFAAPPSPKNEWVKPAFCNSNDCPKFVTAETGDGYELRRYEPAVWVSTSFTAFKYEEGSRDAFNRLFRYIQGANADGAKIKMTSPVASMFKPGTGPNCKSNFTMSFYIPYSIQSNAPAPTEATVFLESVPETSVYVRSYPGYTTEEDVMNNVMALSQAVGDSTKFHREFFYRSGYDSPYKWWDRHNEVWLMAKN